MIHGRLDREHTNHLGATVKPSHDRGRLGSVGPKQYAGSTVHEGQASYTGVCQRPALPVTAGCASLNYWPSAHLNCTPDLD